MNMLGIERFFRQENEIAIQAFGKLPFYQDYIAVLNTAEANQWRSWLLSVFSKENLRIPKGRWPFVFNFSPQSKLVVGLIEDSSDGIREFPFSIFAICHGVKKEGWFKWDTIIEIWQVLSYHRDALASKDNIDACYRLLRSKTINIRNGKAKMGIRSLIFGSGDSKKVDKKDKEEYYLWLNHKGKWPIFLVAPGIKARRLHLLADADDTDMQIINNWGKM